MLYNYDDLLICVLKNIDDKSMKVNETFVNLMRNTLFPDWKGNAKGYTLCKIFEPGNSQEYNYVTTSYMHN